MDELGNNTPEGAAEFVAPKTGNLAEDSEINSGENQEVGRINPEIDIDVRKRWERIDNNSEANLKEIFRQLGIDPVVYQELISQEVERLNQEPTVSIYTDYYSMQDILESGEYKPNTYDGGWVQRKLEKWFGMYDTRREAEKKIGILSKLTAKDPHIVYGALYDNKVPDASTKYGKATFLLKRDNIQERTSFTYGDSFCGGVLGKPWTQDFPMTWKDAATARAAMNLFGQPNKSYVEAQIMGGVTLDDIQEVRIPKSEMQKYYEESGLATVITKIQKEFPELKITIVDDEEERLETDSSVEGAA